MPECTCSGKTGGPRVCLTCVIEDLEGERPGYRRRVSCSWCHALNPDGVRWCSTCGHRADKARIDCDCSKCVNATWKAGAR